MSFADVCYTNNKYDALQRGKPQSENTNCTSTVML